MENDPLQLWLLQTCKPYPQLTTFIGCLNGRNNLVLCTLRCHKALSPIQHRIYWSLDPAPSLYLLSSNTWLELIHPPNELSPTPMFPAKDWIMLQQHQDRAVWMARLLARAKTTPIAKCSNPMHLPFPKTKKITLLCYQDQPPRWSMVIPSTIHACGTAEWGRIRRQF